MLHLSTQFLFERSGIRGVSIREHAFWRAIGNRLSLLKEGVRRLHIPFFTQSDIHPIPLLIDSAIEITSPALDSKIRLIDMPDVAHLPLALSSQVIREDRRKAGFPIPHRFVGELKASKQAEFRHLSVTQLVA